MNDQSRLYGILLLGIAVTGTLLFNRPSGAPPVSVQDVPAAPIEDRAEALAPDVATGGVVELLAAFLGLERATGPAGDVEPVETPEALFGRVVATAERGGTDEAIDVEFVIATIPDWVDSNARWLSDGVLDALQRAMAQSGFVLDRFRFPDLRPGAPLPSVSAPAERGTRHQREPGVILFREASWNPSGNGGAGPDLVVLFLVAETATSGIRQTPFRRAAAFTLAWREAIRRARGDPADTETRLRVMGPTFSGSSPSLRLAIETVLSEAAGRGSPVRVDIMSGSATSDANQALLEGGRRGESGPVTFRATVLPDSVAQAALLDYVCHLLPHSDDATLAILVEGNTGYGQNLESELREAPAAAGAANGPACGRMLTLPFPLHISRLRSDGTGTPRPASGPIQSSAELDLEETATSSDRIPTISPGTTLPHVELVLQNILDTVRREDVAAVGLYATDTRDKLFLAREVSRRSPNVLLFTLESDLLYSHPEYGPYMRGTIVASSYPVFNATQAWTYPRIGEAGRQQFTSTNAHGAYNALIALLNYDLDGVPLHAADRAAPGGAGPPPLLDYRAPSDRGCASGYRPPLWISVAARDGLWPVVFFEPFGCPDATIEDGVEIGRAGYVFRWRPDPAQTSDDAIAHRRTRLLHPSSAAVATFVLVTLLLVAHLLAYAIVTVRGTTEIAGRRWHPRAVPVLRWFSDEEAVRTDPAHGRREHRRYLLACFVALAVAGTACNVLFLIWLVNDGLATSRLGGVESAARTVLVAAAAAVVAGTWLALIAAIVRLTPSVGRPPTTWVAGSTLALAAAFGGFHVWPSLHHVDQWFPAGDQWAWWLALHFERATNPSNWISPTLPILLVAVPLYLWSVLHLGRLSRPRLVVPAVDLDRWSPLARGGRFEWSRLRAMLENANRGLPAWLAVGAALLTFVPKAVIGYDMVTFEGVLASELIDVGVFVAQFVIVLTLVQGLYTWTLSRRLLDGLEHHPMVEAYSRVPTTLLVHPVSPSSPRVEDLRLPVDHATTLVDALQGGAGEASDPPPVPARVVGETRVARLAAIAGSLEQTLDEDESNRVVVWSATATWEKLQEITSVLMPCLDTWWRRRVRLLDSLASDGERQTLTRWFDAAEDLVAVEVVMATREVLRRIVRMLGFVVLAQAILLGAHVFFPFQQRQLNIGVDWVYLGLAIGAALWVFAQMDRQRILCRVASETNRTRWSRDFVQKILLYGVLPLLGLFAAYFPEVGGAFFQWVQRLQSPLL